VSRTFCSAPLRIDGRGRTARVDADAHVRELIAAVLFTNPGERVNLPDFGCGLRQIVFAPNGDTLATALEPLIASALDRWVSDWIRVNDVRVAAADATVTVTLVFTRRDTQELQQMTLVR
jgi:phage baseplate assembly protein W